MRAVPSPRVSTPVAITILCFAVLSLRWPLRVSIETARGAGHTDTTILAFISTFLMIAAGIPGVLAVVVRSGALAGPTRILVVVSLLSLIVGCLGTLVWIAASVRMIGGTLSPVQVLVQAAPPAISVVGAAWLRLRVRGEVQDIDS